MDIVIYIIIIIRIIHCKYYNRYNILYIFMNIKLTILFSNPHLYFDLC